MSRDVTHVVAPANEGIFATWAREVQMS